MSTDDKRNIFEDVVRMIAATLGLALAMIVVILPNVILYEKLFRAYAKRHPNKYTDHRINDIQLVLYTKAQSSAAHRLYSLMESGEWVIRAHLTLLASLAGIALYFCDFLLSLFSGGYLHLFLIDIGHDKFSWAEQVQHLANFLGDGIGGLLSGLIYFILLFTPTTLLTCLFAYRSAETHLDEAEPRVVESGLPTMKGSIVNIIVRREAEEYGPYTIEEIAEYIASGNIVGDDVARADGTAEWTTVDALLLAVQNTPTRTANDLRKELVASREAIIAAHEAKVAAAQKEWDAKHGGEKHFTDEELTARVREEYPEIDLTNGLQAYLRKGGPELQKLMALFKRITREHIPPMPEIPMPELPDVPEVTFTQEEIDEVKRMIKASLAGIPAAVLARAGANGLIDDPQNEIEQLYNFKVKAAQRTVRGKQLERELGLD